MNLFSGSRSSLTPTTTGRSTTLYKPDRVKTLHLLPIQVITLSTDPRELGEPQVTQHPVLPRCTLPSPELWMARKCSLHAAGVCTILSMIAVLAVHFTRLVFGSSTSHVMVSLWVMVGSWSGHLNPKWGGSFGVVNDWLKINAESDVDDNLHIYIPTTQLVRKTILLSVIFGEMERWRDSTR